MAEASAKGGTGARLKVRLVRSRFGRLRNHRACIRGLGLSRIGQQVEVEDTQAIRGMIRKVSYLLEVEEA